MKSILNWLDNRTGIGNFWNRCASAAVPGKPCFCRSLASAIGLLVLIQLITGAILFMYYSASAQTAWESVYFIQHEICGGWLLRAVHHYTAQTLLVLIGIYIVSMIFRGAARAPREFVFWTLLTMGLLVLGLLLTGDLLEWDQNSQSATKVRTNFLMLLPVIGEPLRKLAIGGSDFGHLTLTRFLAYHILLADLFVVLTAGLLWFRHRVVRQEVEDLPKSSKSPYWPGQAIANMAACCFVVGVVLALALSHGVSDEHRGLALGVPADSTEFFSAARPEWAFVGLYALSNLFPGDMKLMPIFVIPTVLVALFYLMPFFNRLLIGRIFSILLILVLLGGNFYLTYDVYMHDMENEAHQLALLESRHTADRTRELIRENGGVPVGGTLELLKNDPMTQGPKLFKKHCASCHAYTGGTEYDIPAEEVLAPNLFGFGTREWVSGWFNLEKITSPDYFGNTAFKNGEMVETVESLFPPDDLDEDDIADRESIVMALSAKAGLVCQAKMDKKDAERIEEGQDLLTDCTDCHKLGDEGDLGTAPELTDYASRKWTIEIISNPAAKRFYGDRNDQMPLYAEFEDESKNIMTNHQIEMLADWLRSGRPAPKPATEEPKADKKKEKEAEEV